MSGDLEKIINNLRMIQSLKVDGEELPDEKHFAVGQEDKASKEESSPAC